MLYHCHIKLPWWFSGKESVCQCRRHRFEPWSGKIPHAAKQLNPCNYPACAIEPSSHNYWSRHTLEPVLHNRKGHCNEKPTPQWREPLLATTRENSVQQQRPSTAINKILKDKKNAYCGMRGCFTNLSPISKLFMVRDGFSVKKTFHWLLAMNNNTFFILLTQV